MSINDFVNFNKNDVNNTENTPYGNSGKNSLNKLSEKLPKFSKTDVKLPGSLKPLKKNHIAGAAIVLVIAVGFLLLRNFAPQTTLGEVNGDSRTEAPEPIATQGLNRSFEFPLLDEKGKEVAKIKYLVESANIQDAFIYKGSMATAVKGRTFLIFNLKITNPYKDTIEVNTRDYIRVKVNGNNEQLAPEIHNDPVEIQGNSTKYVRIGLPINDTDKDIVVLVGELEGNKQEIKLNLKR